MGHSIPREKDVEFDLESGGNSSEDDVGNDLYVSDRESKGAFGWAWNGILNVDGSDKGKSGIESCSNSAKSGDFGVMDENNLELFVDKGFVQHQLSHVNGNHAKQKTNPFIPKKPPKPPLPPRGPSLDAVDQKFVKELAELALRKRARVKKMKAVRKMKASKSSSSSTYTSLSAMVITVFFFLVIILHGRWSKSATESIKGQFPEASMYWESQHIGRYATLLQLSRQVCEAAYRVEEDYEDTLLMLSNHLKKLNLKNRNTCSQQNIQRERLSDTAFDGILDPVVIGRNSEHQSMNDESNRRRRIQRCGRCGAVGHNIRRCTAAFQSEQQAGGGYDIPSGGDNYNYAMFMENPDSFIPSTSRRNV